MIGVLVFVYFYFFIFIFSSLLPLKIIHSLVYTCIPKIIVTHVDIYTYWYG